MEGLGRDQEHQGALTGIAPELGDLVRDTVPVGEVTERSRDGSDNAALALLLMAPSADLDSPHDFVLADNVTLLCIHKGFDRRLSSRYVHGFCYHQT